MPTFGRKLSWLQRPYLMIMAAIAFVAAMVVPVANAALVGPGDRWADSGTPDGPTQEVSASVSDGVDEAQPRGHHHL